ncbi:MAG: hypothetical protein KDB88_09595 [Flavobacteriales bacterium]|nr:hypothetical protein [Flavobacteriales bacterium]
MRTFRILPQPDDSSCGPTALHAVYSHFGLEIPLPRILSEVDMLDEGGTLAVMLGIHALQNGLQARIHSYNLLVFDPSWKSLDASELRDKVLNQLEFKSDPKLRVACAAYARFLDLGGTFAFEELDARLLHEYLSRDLPILTGLSATYLYGTEREYTNEKDKLIADDLRGGPTGHFVVLYGMEGDRIRIADPYQDNPFSPARKYEERVQRVINAILLGVLTFDANLLVLSKDPL